VVEKPIFIEKIIERPREILVEEEEPEDTRLKENNIMSIRRIQNLEQERAALMNEINTLRAGPLQPQQNTNIDYSQAIRELSAKNLSLRNQLMEQQRVHGMVRNNEMQERDKQNMLMRRLDELNRQNMMLKQELGA
jgi:hypothetical protein